MSYAQATLVNQTRQLLSVDDSHYLSNEAMDTTELGLDVTDGTQWSVGDVAEFQDDGELCLVQSISSNTLTVIRNYLYSVTTTAGTGTTHSTSADLVKNPVYRFSQVTQAVAAALRNLWPHVYKKVQTTITPVSGTYWYKVDAEMYELSRVVQKRTDNKTLTFYGRRREGFPVSIEHDLPASFPEATTVAAVKFDRFDNYTNTVLVTGIAPLNDDVTTNAYDDISEGVQAETVKYLAAAELIGSRDIYRTTEQDASMGDQATSPGASTRLAAYWRREGIVKREQWKAELRTTLPRMRGA